MTARLHLQDVKDTIHLVSINLKAEILHWVVSLLFAVCKNIISDNYTNEYVEQNNCKRIVYLGSGSTYDLSTYDNYTSFTNSNFIVGITSGGIGCDTYMAGNGNRYSYSVNPSYNSSTGKLTISVGGSSSASSCAFYSFSANYNVYLIY